MEYPVPDPLSVEQIFSKALSQPVRVWEDNGTYIASGLDGKVDSGTNATTVLQSALDYAHNQGGLSVGILSPLTLTQGGSDYGFNYGVRAYEDTMIYGIGEYSTITTGFDGFGIMFKRDNDKGVDSLKGISNVVIDCNSYDGIIIRDIYKCVVPYATLLNVRKGIRIDSAVTWTESTQLGVIHVRGVSNYGVSFAGNLDTGTNSRIFTHIKDLEVRLESAGADGLRVENGVNFAHSLIEKWTNWTTADNTHGMYLDGGLNNLTILRFNDHSGNVSGDTGLETGTNAFGTVYVFSPDLRSANGIVEGAAGVTEIPNDLVPRDGSRGMTGNLAIGSNLITGTNVNYNPDLGGNAGVQLTTDGAEFVVQDQDDIYHVHFKDGGITKFTSNIVTLPTRGSDPGTSILTDGETAIYVSDGTADVTGDDGDVILAVNSGGTIKTKILADFSAL